MNNYDAVIFQYMDRSMHLDRTCRQISNISRTLTVNISVDHSDAVAPITSSFSTQHLASIDRAKVTTRRERNTEVWWFGATYIKDLTVYKNNRIS